MMIAGIQSASPKEYAVFDIVGDSISVGVNPETNGDYGWADMLFGLAKDSIPAKSNTI